MNQVIIVGCDLHDRSLLLKAACGMDAPQQKSFLNDCDGRQAMLDYLLGFAQQHQADRSLYTKRLARVMACTTSSPIRGSSAMC